jgi:hypothetical protein
MAFPSRRSTTSKDHWKPRRIVCLLGGVILARLSSLLKEAASYQGTTLVVPQLLELMTGFSH